MIIDQLSSGLYESPAACLKELVNNAYDADATEVFMSVRPDADLIVIEDNGTGLNKNEFIRHFERIARSYKREGSETTKRGRPKIGKIGIGFIAANEICDRLQIISTKQGSPEMLEVTLDFAQMRLDADQRRRGEDAVAKADYFGEVLQTAELDAHFTTILLSNVKGESRELLHAVRSGKTENSLYGLATETVRSRLADTALRSWDDFDFYSRTLLQISENVPIRYYDDWAGIHAGALANFTNAAIALDFRLIVDGTELRKPIVLPQDSRYLLRIFQLVGTEVSADGYMFAVPHKINPSDVNGLLIRIRNAAVGRYDNHYLGFPSTSSPLIQNWVTVELYADNRLEDALNIDRRTLRITQPSYLELETLLHAELLSFFSETRRELYGKGSIERKTEVARTQAVEIEELARKIEIDSKRPPENETRPIPLPRVVDPALPRRDALTGPDIARLNRTYKPTEIFALVREVVREVGLEREQEAQLLRLLLERLTSK